MKTTSVIEISIYSVLKVILLILALWFLFVVRDIIAIVFAALIVASALSPVVDKLAKKGLPRGVIILLIYLGIIAIFGGIVYFVLPPAITQIKQLAQQLPSFFDSFNSFIGSLRQIGVDNHLIQGGQYNSTAISDFINNISDNVFATTRGFISGFTALLTVFILTLYLLLDEDGIKKFFTALIPIKQKTQIVGIANKVGQGLGSWLRGQLLLGVIVGTMVYIGLAIMGIPYALTLGLLAAVLEIIPVIGPIISAVPAILIALSISSTTALIVTAFYIIVQELENKLLVPKVMQRTVGLHPVTIIIVFLVGAKMMGALGILLAVPVTSMVYIILKEWTVLVRPKRVT